MLEDDWLKRVPDNIDKMVAVLPALLVASDPFQSVSSFSNAEAKEIAYDFKLRLLIYYFNQHRPRLPPGLAQGEPLPSFNMQCMISKLWLERNIIEAAHIVSNATNSSRVSFVLTWNAQQIDISICCICSGETVFWVSTMFGMSAMVCFGHSHLQR